MNVLLSTSLWLIAFLAIPSDLTLWEKFLEEALTVRYKTEVCLCLNWLSFWKLTFFKSKETLMLKFQTSMNHYSRKNTYQFTNSYIMFKKLGVDGYIWVTGHVSVFGTEVLQSDTSWSVAYIFQKNDMIYNFVFLFFFYVINFFQIWSTSHHSQSLS